VIAPQIVAAGGALLVPESDNVKLERYILDACGKSRPRVCFVPTASGDDANYIARFYETYARLGASAELLRFFRRTPGNLREFLADFDIVHVGGGNTRSMLAVWRHWEFDDLLREVWERGTVMCGSSAGSICWFDQGLTDSVAGTLTAMPCLSFVAGSNCPHYDGESERRPSYQRLMTAGTIAEGYACDDGAALHFIGRDFNCAVTARPAANAYRVELADGRARERILDAIRL